MLNISTNLLRECCDWQYLVVFMVEVEVVGVEDQGFRRGTGEVRQDDSATKISRVVLKISLSLNSPLLNHLLVQSLGVRVLPDEDIVERQEDGSQGDGEHVENHRENPGNLIMI